MSGDPTKPAAKARRKKAHVSAEASGTPGDRPARQRSPRAAAKGQGREGAASSRPAARRPAGPGRRPATPPAPRGPLHRRLTRPTPSDLLALLVLGLTAALGACAGHRDGNGNAGGGGGGTLPAGQVTVRFLDVGQGDAVLVRSPEGKTMLVDGGRSTTRMKELLQTYGVSKVDLMVATHADSDHITGLITAAQEANPTLFVNNGLAGTTKTWERLVAALRADGTTFQKASNQIVNLGSVRVHVLAPPAGMGDDQNDNSVGVRLEFGRFGALMTGDSETPETRAWLAEDRPEARGPVQVYKSIHHGAANGDNQAWLDAVKPETVTISVGPNNYGHPTRAALDLYAKNGVKVYRTDEQGTVTFTGSADGSYKVTTEK
ncbi:ComEC/Rec2 family competence protein [Deinococcus gobiensis]|uniref:ComEC/Rec2 family competence protein n=1 Tax=Deinococcus gobiensis TaxID=502394 RepID=UPI0002E5FA92|nr:ComEC/Rec2 family competence protein [Deinococcus gobiensis]